MIYVIFPLVAKLRVRYHDMRTKVGLSFMASQKGQKNFSKLVRRAHKLLQGKHVSKVVSYEDGSQTSVQIVFNDGTTFTASARRGGGADDEWYPWTLVEIKNVVEHIEIINE